MLSRVPITFGNGAGAVFDELLGVAQPYISAVGQAGNLQQVGEGLGLGFNQHLTHKVACPSPAGKEYRSCESISSGGDAQRLRST